MKRQTMTVPMKNYKLVARTMRDICRAYGLEPPRWQFPIADIDLEIEKHNHRVKVLSEADIPLHINRALLISWLEHYGKLLNSYKGE